MDLILWRHAHAGDPLPEPAQDLQRALSTKGERQASRMGAWLNQQLPESTRVLASHHSVDDLLLTARYPLSREPVLVVGHQPTLGLAVAKLLEATDPSQPWSVKKGSVWWLRTREREGQVQLTLHAVISPENL